MSELVTSVFAPLAAPKGGVYVAFVGASLKAAPAASKFLAGAADQIAAAAKTANFRGKSLTSMDILAPSGVDCERLLVIGVEGDKENKNKDLPVAQEKREVRAS